MGTCNSKTKPEKPSSNKLISYPTEEEVYFECFLSNIQTTNIDFLVNNKTLTMGLSTPRQSLCELVIPSKEANPKTSFSSLETHESRFTIKTNTLTNDKLIVVS